MSKENKPSIPSDRIKTVEAIEAVFLCGDDKPISIPAHLIEDREVSGPPFLMCVRCGHTKQLGEESTHDCVPPDHVVG